MIWRHGLSMIPVYRFYAPERFSHFDFNLNVSSASLIFSSSCWGNAASACGHISFMKTP